MCLMSSKVEPDKYLTVAEVSARLAVSGWQTRRLIASGALPAVNVAAASAGHPTYRVRESDVEGVHHEPCGGRVSGAFGTWEDTASASLGLSTREVAFSLGVQPADVVELVRAGLLSAGGDVRKPWTLRVSPVALAAYLDAAA